VNVTDAGSGSDGLAGVHTQRTLATVSLPFGQ
jgi:hypothetical protein